MYDVRTIRKLGDEIPDVDGIATVIVATMLHRAPVAPSVGKFLKYLPVEGDAFAFDAVAHQISMRFKFRHTLFEFKGREELAGEFDWYVLGDDPKLTLIGSGIQVLTPSYVVLPNGETIEVKAKPAVHELEQLEAKVSLVVLAAIQSRLVLMKRHE